MTSTSVETGSESDSRFDPFRRTDRFGDIGEGPLPTATWIALYARLIVLGPLRLLACLCGALLMRAACFVSQRIPATRAYVLAPAAMAIARGMLLALGFLRIQHTSWRSAPHSRHSAAGTAPRSRHSAGGSSNGSAGSAVAAAAEQLQDELRSRDETPIVVCNHVSWLDILLVQCFYAAAFVARVEQRSVPIIGGICDALPCVYVDREKGSNSAPSPSSASSSVASGAKSTTDKVVDRINAKYADKDAPLRPLVIFAEGTTTNGKYLLPFRTGAFVAGKPVQPVLLSYGRHKDGPSLSWETIEFPSHLKLVLSTLFHTARVVELPVYHPSADEQRDAGLYARNVRAYMMQWAGKAGMEMQMAESTYKDKKEFHNILREKHGIPLKR